jgi:tRNA A58 N-methylase Trm61
MKKPISLEQLKARSQGHLLEIPDWYGDEPIVVRVQKLDFTPKVMELVALGGALPNQLADVALRAFKGEEVDASVLDLNLKPEEEQSIEQLMKTVDAFAEQALMEPTIEQIRQAGLELTAPQKMAIFNWLMEGLQKLSPFRK